MFVLTSELCVINPSASATRALKRACRPAAQPSRWVVPASSSCFIRQTKAQTNQTESWEHAQLCGFTDNTSVKLLKKKEEAPIWLSQALLTPGRAFTCWIVHILSSLSPRKGSMRKWAPGQGLGFESCSASSQCEWQLPHLLTRPHKAVVEDSTLQVDTQTSSRLKLG